LLFQRNKFTIENDQTQALYFFDSATSKAVIEDERKTKYISSYQLDNTLPFIEVQVTNIILGDLTTAPIEFLKLYKDPNSGAELRRERWTASVNFIFRTTVPNNMVSINPLGLTIIHYRVDQAYSVQPTVAAPPAPPAADKLQQVLQGKEK
jgi:type IV secretion system protein VirB5